MLRMRGLALGQLIMDLSPARSGAEDKALQDRVHPVVDQVVTRIPRAPRNGLAQSLQYRRLQLYVALLVLDALVLLGSFALAGLAYQDGRSLNVAMMPAYLLLPLFQTIALYNATYSQDGLEGWQRSLGRGVMALLISALLLNFFAFMSKSNEQFSRAIFAFGVLGTIAGMAVCRVLMARFIRHMWGPNVLNFLLIEAGGPAVRIPHIYRVDAAEHALAPDLEDPVMLDRLARYIRNMDRVIVSCRPQDRVAWAEILKCSGVHGEVISEYARQIGALGVVHHADAGVTGLLVSAGQLGMRSRAMKRMFDLSTSLVALVVLSPLLLLCAIAIKLEDGGSVFFRQRRMGRGNTFFDIFKFRSMREAKADAAGSRSASKDDDRITRVGRILRRTSLDELPQLINVFLGDMSIVGPRPHALGSQAGQKMFWQVDRKYWQRHCLRPGITGLAQIRGLRGATDTEGDLSARLDADLEYLSHWSLFGDIWIALSTLKVLVHDRAF